MNVIKYSVLTLPCCRAVFVQNVELLSGEELAAVHSRLDRPKSPQDTDLLYVTNHGRDVQSL